MKWWPFGREPEHRAGSYESAVVDAIAEALTGETTAAGADGLAATEAAAGLIGRCFASAEVMGDRFELITPAVLETIGRQLVLAGEVVYAIEGMAMPVLRLVGTWDIRGDVPENSWTYRCDTFGPTDTRSAYLPAASVVHCRINCDPVRPWFGRSPVRIPSSTAATAGEAERSAKGEAKIPPARIAPTPATTAAERVAYGVKLGKGGVVPVTAATQPVTGAGQEPASRWQPAAMRPDPTPSHVQLRREAAADVLSACGIPPVLFDMAKADSASRREAYRQLTFTTLQPWGRLVEAELRDKLDSPELALSFAGLHGADLATRGRALKQLTESGVTLAEAMAITGLDMEGGA